MKNTTLLLFLLVPFTTFSQLFTDVTVPSGIDHVYDYADIHFGGGVAVLDFNNDGFEDLYITGGINPDLLYKNNGDGTFTDATVLGGFTETASFLTIGATAGDINNDGWVDLFVTTRGSSHPDSIDTHRHNLLYKNNGNGTFTEIGNSSGIQFQESFTTSALFADYNNDGYLDLSVLNFLDGKIYAAFDSITGLSIPQSPRVGSENYLFLNNGDETFTEVGGITGVRSLGAAWAGIFSDYDRDNDLDLYVANDFGPKTEYNQLYRNNYPVNDFSELGFDSKTNTARNAMGVDAGDFNEDGWLDYYVTDIHTNLLYKNNGDGTFDSVAVASGVDNAGWNLSGDNVTSVSWGTNFFDYDHDSYLDLFVSNGAINPIVVRFSQLDTFVNYNTMYKNDGTGSFTDVSGVVALDNPQRSRGSVIFDYDNDGDMDLFVVNQRHFAGYGIGQTPKSNLYRNDVASGNWLKIKLEGINANKQGIGSRVEIYVGGRTLIREIHAGSSHLSCSSPIAHFGLGQMTMVDSIKVNWLNGNVNTVFNVNMNQQLDILEDTSFTNPTSVNELNNNLEIFVYPNPATDHLILEFGDKTIGNYNFKLFDITGKQLLEETIRDKSNTRISVSNLNSGIYLYEIATAKGVKRGKLEIR